MKINNKGLTLVELIVAFVILVMFLFGMLEIVLTVKSKASEEIFARDLITFKDTVIKTIEDDLIKKKLNPNGAVCETNTSCVFNFQNDTTATLTVNTSTKTIEYAGMKYEIPNSERIYFGTISMTTENVTSDEVILTIDIPYYEIETATPNYGIKIVHPYSRH